MSEALIRINDLSIEFTQGEQHNRVVNQVSLALQKGETLALVGESGSGKTVTALSILRLLPEKATHYPSGEILYDGQDMLKLPNKALQMLRGAKIGVIFQEPMMSLNPLHTVEKQLTETLFLHQRVSRQQARTTIREWLIKVGIDNPDERMRSYPHQLSGGQQQRIMIAMALINEPDLLIADEPTTALDVTIQAQILDLINQLKQELGMAVLFITHDLGIVKQIADRVAVMCKGDLVETNDTQTLFNAPQHPYTQQLLDNQLPLRQDPIPDQATTLLEVDNLKVWFPIQRGLLRRTIGHVKAVDGISLQLRQGESLGIVGESGSGKTTLTHTLLRLTQHTAGNITFQGQDISTLNRQQMRPLRRTMQLIFQDPFGSLSPRLSVEQIIAEGLDIHDIGTETERAKKVLETMELVELDPAWRHRYPHEFSGGQRQRIAIARALIMEPELVVLDEPTSALDRTIQTQIIDLLIRLQHEKNLSYIFITHDLGVVRAMCHNILVMQNGRLVESNSTAELFNHPQHPYTQQLLASALY